MTRRALLLGAVAALVSLAVLFLLPGRGGSATARDRASAPQSPHAISPLEGRVAVYYINLDSRPERRKRMEALLEHLFPRLHCQRIPGVVVPGNGRLGCLRAHVAANLAGLAGDTASYIIMEDDLELLEPAEVVARTVRDALAQAADLLLYEQGAALEFRVRMCRTAHPSFFRIAGGGNNAGCYHVTDKAFGRRLVECWEKSAGRAGAAVHADQAWQTLWPSSRVLFAKPQLFAQGGGRSDTGDFPWKLSTGRFRWKLWEAKQGLFGNACPVPQAPASAAT